jgi:hypothetical protein
MSLFKRQCSWPGCENYDYIADTGRCARHGKWAACSRHELSRHDTFRTVRRPLCEWESPRIQDPLEAKRRNDAEDAARRKRREDCEAQFRARGYGTQAAEAMASKKLREQA